MNMLSVFLRIYFIYFKDRLTASRRNREREIFLDWFTPSKSQRHDLHQEASSQNVLSLKQVTHPNEDSWLTSKSVHLFEGEERHLILR